MMMRREFRLLIPLVLLMISLSCKKNNTSEPPAPTPDTTVPTIVLTDPTPDKTLVLGTALHLQMDLSDNFGLKSYKVTIAKSLKGLVTSDWFYDSGIIIIAAGKKTLAVNNNDITVPLTVTGNQTTTGNYDMVITCLDTSNNETSKTLTIVLTK
jgi:hypothetical protein